jgi:SEC-C motif
MVESAEEKAAFLMLPRGTSAEPFKRRNHPCSCGSGKKYKKCCWKKDIDPDPNRAFAPKPNKPTPRHSSTSMDLHGN